jgi:hypothetical protein
MASKRSRKRRSKRPRPAPAPEAAAVAARKRVTPGGPPPPPWGSFPLSELVVLVAIVMLVAGFFVGPPRGAILLGTGLVLGSLAGLELGVREHFSGYRSHTTLLAGAVGIAVVAALLIGAKLAPIFGAVGGLIAFAAAAYMFAGAFRRRSGGALFKFKGS